MVWFLQSEKKSHWRIVSREGIWYKLNRKQLKRVMFFISCQPYSTTLCPRALSSFLLSTPQLPCPWDLRMLASMAHCFTILPKYQSLTSPPSPIPFHLSLHNHTQHRLLWSVACLTMPLNRQSSRGKNSIYLLGPPIAEHRVWNTVEQSRFPFFWNNIWRKGDSTPSFLPILIHCCYYNRIP